MRLTALCGWVGLVWGLGACGAPQRDNPLDPRVDPEGAGVELVARFPGTQPPAELIAYLRYQVSAPDLGSPVRGEMNLVGGEARAEVRGVPTGSGRIFRVEAFDANLIRTFAGADTVLVADPPAPVHVRLERLQGSLELSAQLPPEIAKLEVRVIAGGDTLSKIYEVEGLHEGRINGIPTGTGVQVELSGRDNQEQVLLERRLAADVRDDLVAHLSLSAQSGALQITAHFPPYVARVAIDRFSDEAAVIYRRSNRPQLPGPGAAINFDGPLFLHRGYGPNGEVAWFYNLDVRTTQPAPVYVLVDRIGQPLAGQLPIFDLLPGQAGYSDLWQIHQVRILDRDYPLNSLSSLEALSAAGYEITPGEEIMHCALVPPGSTASLRFDPATPAAAQQGWYRDQIVDYLLFEHPNSVAQVDFGAGRINAPEMFAFFENDVDISDGFALDPLGAGTHNVATRLPGQEGYAPLWVLTVFRVAVFDQVQSVASALDQSRNDASLIELPELIHVDAPIVKVE
ncbi:MAG: hypothetical protein FJY95_13065 [Candidatus Handelsmanbacteria bacterium]|nr:hypothetical protein [Candidatus Handelsmanbacteria bacterium]